VLIGLPDTIWFPENVYRMALDRSAAEVNLLLFPVINPAAFDAVLCDEQQFVTRVEVKQPDAHSHWIWGAITATGEAFRTLKLLWESRHREDEFLGHLLNAYIKAGSSVRGHFAGETYMDVGTLGGYHAAQDFLRGRTAQSNKVTRAA
jgi:glucose-1-phosphate thymidylyltransferase